MDKRYHPKWADYKLATAVFQLSCAAEGLGDYFNTCRDLANSRGRSEYFSSGTVSYFTKRLAEHYPALNVQIHKSGTEIRVA
jgi:hypothetical protein